MNTKTLLDGIKAKHEIKSDYALAKKLSLPSGHICDYYQGKRTPNEFACLQIARALGKDYAEISAIVRIEAERDESRREEWIKFFRSLATAGKLNAQKETAPVSEETEAVNVGRCTGLEPVTLGITIRCSTN